MIAPPKIRTATTNPRYSISVGYIHLVPFIYTQLAVGVHHSSDRMMKRQYVHMKETTTKSQAHSPTTAAGRGRGVAPDRLKEVNLRKDRG